MPGAQMHDQHFQKLRLHRRRSVDRRQHIRTPPGDEQSSFGEMRRIEFIDVEPVAIGNGGQAERDPEGACLEGAIAGGGGRGGWVMRRVPVLPIGGSQTLPGAAKSALAMRAVLRSLR